MATRKVDTNLDFSGVSAIVRALMNPVASDPGAPGVGELWYNSTSNRLKYNDGTVKTLANLDDVTAGSITGALWDAQTVVTAIVDDTPVAQVIGEAEVLGRLTGGNIGAVTFAALLSALEALGIDASTVGGSDPFARANHTGTQTTGTLSDFNTAVDARAQAIVDAVVDAAPGTLDTLNELAAALGDDPNFSTTITNAIAAKTGKFSANIGNGALQTFTVNHNLGTTDVVVMVRNNASGAVVDCEITVDDANNVGIDVNSVPTTDQLRVVVIG